MSQKTQKPTLTGQRIKTRKRDEKEKYDPSSFRDQIVAGLNEVNADLELASKFLIQSGSKLDFRRYAEALLDILITGGILAPGGTIVTDNAAISSICVFNTEQDVDNMRNVIQLFERMIRQYKYLEKSLDDEMKKILMFLKGFTDVQRDRLTLATYLLISSSLIQPTCLIQILNDHLVNEGIALEFARCFFSAWLAEKDAPGLINILKKAEMDGKLMMLFPVHKRSIETFENYFNEADLKPIVDFQRNQNARIVTKEMKSRIKRLLEDESTAEEITSYMQETCEKNKIENLDIIPLLWSSLMKGVEWNKKEDLLAEQILRHLKTYASVLQRFTTTPATELLLLQKIQEFCYDNMSFLKLFQKIVMLLYKVDVIGEDTIIKWFKSGHSSKGKSVFLAQMEKMVEWLQSAEEESSEEEDDDEEEED
ncbi:eIF5-mimic protein 2-A-like [Clytia hemisphaerica]|uniref:W2 domain-containing protein n=1 Tax=Clytia hemisphaerica TaxID=252671 RepID=A0A7M5WRL2_9CNID|eukprot:TCONS_00051327-protein